MPSKKDDVEKFFERLAILETKMIAVMSFQKWQMGALAMILAAIIGSWVSR